MCGGQALGKVGSGDRRGMGMRERLWLAVQVEGWQLQET